MRKHRFITFGEIMLRLTPPGYEKICMTNSFEANYGGAEANIALSLANLGIESSFFSVVPDNAIGKSAIRMLRSNDVDCNSVIMASEDEAPSHRLGVYYLEAGYGIRRSNVIYDRKHSAITEYDFSKVDVEGLLKDYTWLHISGITPALSQELKDFILKLLRVAKSLDITVSFDGNFRSNLWSWEAARDFCTKCLPYIDVLSGIEPFHLYNLKGDEKSGDVKDGLSLQPNYEDQDRVFKSFVQQYANIKCIGRHVRFVHSGTENSLKAYFWMNGQTYESNLYRFTILDRVGSGDAFAAGMIYGIMQGFKPQDIANFAVAASVIKHTIRGDGNVTDDEESIRSIMNMNYEIVR